MNGYMPATRGAPALTMGDRHDNARAGRLDRAHLHHHMEAGADRQPEALRRAPAAAMIATMRRDTQPLRLQLRGRGFSSGHGVGAQLYRAARPNGWHCGHWHRTPEDAVACAVAKGEPMQ